MALERRQVQLDQALPHRPPRLSPAAPAVPRPVGTLAPELGFLSLQGVAPGLLLKAARRAEELGVPADQALLGEDFPEEAFYRLLARHLGVPYLDAPMPLALPPCRSPHAIAAGAAKLAVNRCGLDHVLAPRGDILKALLRLVGPGQGRVGRFAICSPRCLAALVRRHDRRALLHQATDGLADWRPALSAKRGPTSLQRAAAALFAVLLSSGLMLAPALTGTIAALGFALVFLASVLLRLGATVASLGAPPDPGPPVADRDLPVYTVVVPLFRETRIVPQLIDALDRLDYPRAKLDIKIMLEAGDKATIAVLEALCLPARYDVIVTPPGRPQTKPRALNFALPFARGSLLVVFDAEDRPEADQLRRAVARFAILPETVACLQARLAIDHEHGCWLVRMFALDYAGLFQVVTPGLAALHLPIALGGTSNHFRVAALRRVNGWDAWNVTEDIDLGYRLARFGYRVATLDSTTFEEAPVTLKAWLAQRRRWLKGWMITLVVHAREPRRALREFGLRGGAAVVSALFGTVLSCLLGPVFLGLVVASAWHGSLLAPKTLAETCWSALSLSLLLFGCASLLWPMLLGARRQGLGRDIGWLATYPLYLALVSLAAWLALAEAVGNPFGWNKTEHGLARRRGTMVAPMPLRAGEPQP